MSKPISYVTVLDANRVAFEFSNLTEAVIAFDLPCKTYNAYVIDAMLNSRTLIFRDDISDEIDHNQIFEAAISALPRQDRPKQSFRNGPIPVCGRRNGGPHSTAARTMAERRSVSAFLADARSDEDDLLVGLYAGRLRRRLPSSYDDWSLDRGRQRNWKSQRSTRWRS